MEFSAKEIAQILNGEIVGNSDVLVHTFAKIEEGVPGALSFLANPKYTSYIYSTHSDIVLVHQDFTPTQPVSATLIKVANPYESLAKLMSLYQAAMPKKKGIHPLAFVDETATIGENVYIGAFACVEEGAVVGANSYIHPHVTIGAHARVGEECTLYPHSTIYHNCRVGNRCVIHAGAVVGADGFGFAPSENGYEKIPQIGVVTIEDDVEIGANTCIDRATMGATIIRKGAKLDNLIQVAHNVQIGSHTVMAAQVGVAGSTQIGEWCMFGGQAGIAGHIQIGNKVGVGAQTGIPNSVKDHAKIMGTPAMDGRAYARSSAVYKKLPEMYTELSRLQKELEEIKKELTKK